MVKRMELDDGLKQLQGILVEMGKRVEKALSDAMDALARLDAAAARAIVASDLELNRLEEQVAELGAKLIATQQPVATDLRRILAALKISSDLERMGDLSVDIAKTALRLEGQTLLKPLVDLPRMADIARTMVRESIQSYLEENVNLAYKMAKDDDQVDTIFAQVFREMITVMAGDAKWINQAMLLSFVARYVERIADHATNIGESVVFLVMGNRPDLN